MNVNYIHSSETISGLALQYIPRANKLIVHGWIRGRFCKWEIFPITVINITLKYKDFYTVFPSIKCKILSLKYDMMKQTEKTLHDTVNILSRRNPWDEQIFVEMS